MRRPVRPLYVPVCAFLVYLFAEHSGQSEHDAIARREIRCAMSGSIADQNVMFERKRLRGNGAYATRAEQLHEGDQQVDGEDEEFAHGVNATSIASTRKTAPHRRIPSYVEFATHRVLR
jgi:hypothetical protein